MDISDINKISSSKMNYQFTPVDDFPTYDEVVQKENPNSPNGPAPTN